MKRFLIIYSFLSLISLCLHAQDVVPKAKTKAQQKADRKKMSLEERIEDTLPVDVNLPKASVNLPGDNQISSVEDAKKFLSETLPSLSDNVKAKSKKARKAIEKAKLEIFDGKNYEKIAVEKRIFKRGSGSKLQYQEFFVLKQYQKPNPYLRTLFWYDEKTKKVVEALTRDTKTNRLLHGPFKEYRGETLIHEGFYFLGAKHGRWLEFDKDFNLINKEYYHKGFYENSEISYHDKDSTKIKEVIPKLYGKTTGNYFLFHEDGSLAMEGKYDDGKKIGKWVEYYEGGNRRKRETQHAGSFFDPATSYILREYDEKGKLIAENSAPK
jgi:antitoxin component YwqK of YwqJK toxin-antitoxin module